jgi:hypothetical protein
MYLFVKADQAVPATGVTLDSQTASVDINDTTTLKATVTPAGTTYAGLTWTSSDTGVATVSDGVVTGIAVGTATITATTNSGEAATCTVTVTAPVVDRYVKVDSLKAGGEYIITNDATVGGSSTRALKNPGGSTNGVTISSTNGKTTVTILEGNIIETTDTDIVWTATSNGTTGGYYLTNNGDYLEVYQQALRVFSNEPKQAARYWTYNVDDDTNDKQLRHKGGNSTYALYYTNGSFSASSSTTNATYIFEKVTDTPHTHTYGEPTYTWATDNSTCTAIAVCSGCEEGTEGHSVNETVTPTYAVTTEATCTAVGTGTYTATFTNELFTAQTKNVEIPAIGHNYGAPEWTWEGFTAATAKFTCANDSTHTQNVSAEVTSATDGVVITYTATAAFNGHTYTDHKVDDSKLIKEASATFTLPIVGDDVNVGRPASVPEDANYTARVYRYQDANGNFLTSGTFEAGKTYYAEYSFDVKDGYGFKGGAEDTTGQVPALADRVALTANGVDITEYINDAYTYYRVTALVPFTPENPEFNLTVNAWSETGAAGTATLSKTKAHRGDEITVTATPAPGSVFTYAEYKEAGLEIVAERIGEDGKFIMPPYDTEVTAFFKKAEYTVTVTPNNEAYGTASASYQSWYNMGDEVILTATPNEGYEFKEWKVLSGGVTIANNKFTVGTENVEIQAVFAPKEYTLTFLANEGDTEPYATVTKAYGAAITEADLPAAPTKAFYTFNSWTPAVPETMPAENKTFTATWTAKEAYYLIGSMTEWKVVEANEFVANPDNPAEYSVAATLTADDQIKVAKAVAGEAVNTEYYPSTEHPGYNGQTGNYTVDQYHAGNVTVYFRPAGNFTDQGWQDFGGYFYIEGDHAITVETSPADAGTATVMREDSSEAATSAPKGKALTVNAAPADNYQLDKIEIWKTNGGTAAEQTLEGNTFNMPDYDVTVKVYFKAITWTFVDFTWEQTADGYNAIANYRGDNGSTKTVAATVTSRITTAATCEGEGQIVYTATVTAADSLDGTAQSEDKPVTIPAAGHEYGDLIPEVAPDCTTEGTKAHYECSVCHKLFDTNKVETTAEALKITATGHDWEFVDFSWTGYTAAVANYKCKNDATHTQTVNATVTSVTTPATCETAGKTVYTATVAAADSLDGKAQTADKTVTIPAIEHDWEFTDFTWTGSDEAGYTAAAANYKCKNDATHTQTVNATVTSVTTAATCEVAGKTVYTATVTAADSLDEAAHSGNKTAVIPAIGHKWSAPVWTWTGDDETGYTKVSARFTCQNDPEHVESVETTEIPEPVRVEPTATESGSITYTVSLTGPDGIVYTIQKEIIIPPAGYTYKDPVYTWTETEDGYSVAALKECNEDQAQNITETVTASYAVTTAATCVTDGVGTYTAAFTNSAFVTQTKTETISATGHTEVVDEAVAPTCTETGLTEGSHCSVCGTVLTAQTTVPALGHDWKQPTGQWNADHTSVVLTFVCTRDASHTETVTASGTAITSEITTEPTATEPGVKTYTATVTLDGKTYTVTDTEAIPATGTSVSGSITSFVGNTEEGQVTVQLFAGESETAAYTAKVTSNTSYAFEGVADGTYTMKVSKKDHVARSYEITVSGNAVTQDVKIHLIGDINGDGDVTTVDAARVNSHAKGKTLLTGYEFSCGDINGDGDITTVDAARTNAHAKGASLIW